MPLLLPVRAILTLLLAVLCVAGYGVASAVWTASGSGSGAGSTGAGPVVTLSPGTPGVTVRPGGQADVVLTVSNPNRSAVRLNSLVLDEGEVLSRR
jgi:hypothetical protein